MPTPIGHALGGVVVGLLAAGPPRSTGWRRPDRASQAFLMTCAAAACLPDIDFLWGRHNMETHSVGFAVLVGAAVFLWRRSGRLAVACAVAVISHIAFDWLGSEDSPPLGVMALWPLSSNFYFAHAYVFEAISRRYWLPNFVPHNLLAVAREIAIVGPAAAALWWWRFRQQTR
jgi:membrane-bound metal-dependent hydrolase YbcI (DUF457 family)